MTPEQAETIYYDAYRTAREGCSTLAPVDQRKISLKAWEVVIDALNKEFIEEQIQAYLKSSGPLLNEGS